MPLQDLKQKYPSRHNEPFCVCLPLQQPDILEVYIGTHLLYQGCPAMTFGKLIFVKTEKCEFHISSVVFQVYIVALGSLHRHLTKVSVVYT